jgi:hypothetical protein
VREAFGLNTGGETPKRQPSEVAAELNKEHKKLVGDEMEEDEHN